MEDLEYIKKFNNIQITKVCKKLNIDYANLISGRSSKANVKLYFEEHIDEWKNLYDAVYDRIREKESPYIKSFEELLNLQTKEAFSEHELNMAVDEEGIGNINV